MQTGKMKQKKNLFYIRVLRGTRCVLPKEDTIKIVVGIHGTVKITVEGQPFVMKEEDLLVVNAFETCEIHFESRDSLVVMIEINRQEIVQSLDMNWVPHFECNTVSSGSTDIQKVNYRQLYSLILTLLGAYFASENENDFSIYEKFFKVVSYLVTYFQQTNTVLPKVYNEGIKKIVEKVQKNFDQTLSLEEFAKESYLSYNYLSKKFKEELGVSFREYVKEVRVNHAAEELRYTDTSILKVALNNGFSSSKFFHKAFKDLYGMTPKTFREQRRSISDKRATDSDQFVQLSKAEAILLLEDYLVENDKDELDVKREKQRLISLPKEGQDFRLPDRILNIGQANYWLREENRREISEAVQDLKIKFIRVNGFCYEAKEDNFLTIFSRFQQNNMLFEFIISNKKIPIIALEVPLEKSVAIGNWYAEQQAFIRQLIQQFGREEVANWRFEWVIKKEEKENSAYFFKIVKDLFKWLETPKVGVCLGNLYIEEQYRGSDRFLASIEDISHRLAFFSYHAKPTGTKFWDDNEKVSIQNYQRHNYQLLHDLVKKYKLEGEIYLTDWDTLIGKGETFAGTFFRAALFVKDVFELHDKVSALSIWLNSETTRDASTLAVTGGNSLSLYLVHSLKRPAYLALQLIDKLQGQLLYQEHQLYIIKGEEQMMVLLTNPSYIDPVMSLSSNYLQHKTLALSVTLQNIFPAHYLIKTYSLDKDRGGIYNDWLRLGRLSELDNEMIDYLQRKIMLHFTVSKEEVQDEIQLSEILSFNACRLLVFKPLLFK